MYRLYATVMKWYAITIQTMKRTPPGAKLRAEIIDTRKFASIARDTRLKVALKVDESKSSENLLTLVLSVTCRKWAVQNVS